MTHMCHFICPICVNFSSKNATSHMRRVDNARQLSYKNSTRMALRKEMTHMEQISLLPYLLLFFRLVFEICLGKGHNAHIVVNGVFAASDADRSKTGIENIFSMSSTSYSVVDY